ncbi:MAG: carboxypeptidase-like regulatory domain-containing protein [Myxococcota bacterium]
MVWGWFAMCSLAMGDAHAANHGIAGLVVDRNGAPVSEAIVSLTPGNVELVTDREGRFLIDYLRDPSGERRKLDKKTAYTLEVFKPGYHDFTLPVEYRRGSMELDAVTMIEETVNVQDMPENLDPRLYDRATRGAGATYEGD